VGEVEVIGGGFTTQAYVPSSAAIRTVTNTTIKNLISKYIPAAVASTADPKVGTVSSSFPRRSSRIIPVTRRPELQQSP